MHIELFAPLNRAFLKRDEAIPLYRIHNCKSGLLQQPLRLGPISRTPMGHLELLLSSVHTTLKQASFFLLEPRSSHKRKVF